MSQGGKSIGLSYVLREVAGAKAAYTKAIKETEISWGRLLAITTVTTAALYCLIQSGIFLIVLQKPPCAAHQRAHSYHCRGFFGFL